ncbi:Structural maintenance of chromosomes protein 4 [Aphelenchoides besseyi]|nr:Structural maintenance of chromosomes protein 4 [Aphelenchoides besseyi]
MKRYGLMSSRFQDIRWWIAMGGRRRVVDFDEASRSPDTLPITAEMPLSTGSGNDKELSSSSPRPDDQDDEVNRPSSNSRSDEVEEDLLNMVIPGRPIPVMSTDPSEARLIITRISVENFKSYYGKRNLGPFHKNFTSILGPNGSGKSNVIDSLLFVFGFRANRIRSKKVSTLIHNSAAHPEVKSCKVEIHFAKIYDKEDGYNILRNTPFSVSRTATKSGGSTYHINGKPVSTNEVRDCLRANGIDLDHNRFLILQGEVEQIALMKPKHDERTGDDGMLEYLEDIIGSSRLKEPIMKLKQKLAKLNDEEDMIKKKLDLAEAEVNHMVEPVMEILKMMRLENAITECTHKLLNIRRLNLDQRYKTASDLLDMLNAVQNSAKEDLHKCEGDLRKENKLKADTIKLRNGQTRGKNSRCRAEQSQIRIECKKDERKDQTSSKENSDKRSGNQTGFREGKLQLKLQLEDARAAPVKAEETLKTQDEIIERCQQEIRECEDQLRNLRPKERTSNANNRQKLEEIMPKIIDLNSEEDKCTSNLNVAKDKLERLQKIGSTVEARYTTAENSYKNLEGELSKTTSDLEKIRNRIPEVKTEIENLETDYKNHRGTEHELTNEVNELHREIEQHRHQADGYRTNNATLAALTQEKQNGNIPGIYGRLGDLGAIDEKYDVAISTCCRPLDDVLVDTVETAQDCIKFLKERNLPRITFIVLEKQNHFWSKIKNKPQTPFNHPRLVDMIRVGNESFLPAFYSALRDTLVVDNIDMATTTANHNGQRWRVVTLRGDVIETTGTMAGGGRQEKRGRMGNQVRVDTQEPTKNWTEMENQLKQKRERLNKLRFELSQKTEVLKAKKDELAQLEHRQRLLMQQTMLAQRQVEEAKNEMARAKNAFESLDVDEDALVSLQDDVNRYEREKESVNQRASALRKNKEKLEDEIKKVEEKILGAAQSRLKTSKATLKTAEETQNKANLTLKNADSAIKRFELSISKAKRTIEDTEREIEQATKNLQEQHENAQQEAGMKGEYEEQLESLKTLLVDKTELINSLNNREEELKHQIQDRQGELNEMSKTVESLLAKMNSKGKLSILHIRQDILPFLTEQIQNQPAVPNPNENLTTATIADENRQAVEEEVMEAELTNTTVVTGVDGHVFYDPVCDASGLPTYTEEEVRSFVKEELENRFKKLEAKKRKFKGQMNLQLVEDFGEKMDRRILVTAEMNQLMADKAAHRSVYDRLSRMRSDEFMNGFQKIRLATQEIYQMITLGGDAALDPIDSLDPFKDGICFVVRPPKKTWKQITNLSGGEKTLASLALVFGLHNFRPTPLYVMDEIDAALDYRNVSIIATYLKERTKNAQFIIISLRNNMFEHADRLIGIYKVNDCTMNITYDPGMNILSEEPNVRIVPALGEEENDKRSIGKSPNEMLPFEEEEIDPPPKRRRTSRSLINGRQNL